MLLKPYTQMDKNNLDPYEQTYVGEVLDNNDPDKLKRLKISIPIWDMYTDEQLQWVPPAGNAGASANVDKHDIPEIGSSVTVYFNNKNPDDPRYTGVNVTESTKCSLFDEDYPNTYGEKDSIGNFVMHNKKTGISVFHHNSGTEVQCDPDGSFIVTGNSGCYASCDADGHFRFSGTSFTVIAAEDLKLAGTRVSIAAANALQLKANFLEIIGNNSLSLQSPETTTSGGKLTFENSSVHVVNSMSIEKGASYTIHDPFGKVTAQWVDGVLLTKQPW